MRGSKPGRALERTVRCEGGLLRGERVLVACSGGPDSVALAALIGALAKELHLRYALGHVNHGVRASAWQDEAVVLRLGAALGVPVKIAALERVGRDEAALRAARYEALVGLARESGAAAVATGHNAEDQTETVLLALFRGTGIAGLAGMPVRRPLAPGIDLVRPLLHIGRTELRAYVHAAGLPYALDPTNTDTRLRRNAVREALAGLRPLFPGLDAAVARAAEVLGAELAGTPEAERRRQVRERLREEHGLRDVDFAHVEAAARALQAGGSGRFFIKTGVELTIDRGTFTGGERR